MRYFLQLSYNGKQYCGWQRQPNDTSIQEVIEENLSKLMGVFSPITGCGRTDAGVHAQEYFAHFDTDNKIPDNFIYRINRMLPNDIAIQHLFSVSSNAHARFDAANRTYKYFIHYEKNPFLEDQSFLFLNKNLDLVKMNRCIQQLIGEHDFSTFEKKGSDNKTSVCQLKNAYWEETPNGFVFTITANRFLRNMVRRITAALLMVGLNKLSEEMLLQAVLNKKPLAIKLAVPAKGLFLWKIDYDSVLTTEYL